MGENILVIHSLVRGNLRQTRSKRGASYELVRSIGQADWRLDVSVALALEYEDILKRSGMLQGITEAEIDDFLDYCFQNLEPGPGCAPSAAKFAGPDDERISAF